MNRLLILIIGLFLGSSCRSQNFLQAFKEFKLKTVAPKLKPSQRGKYIEHTNAINIELDTIFSAYNKKTGFDFNKADSLFIIYESPVESPFTGDVIIWSGKDTISYGHELKTLRRFNYRNVVVYKPYLISFNKVSGYKEITERDSLVTLVANRDFKTIQNLGKQQEILDGSTVTIYIASKVNGKYKIEKCSPPQFVIHTVYRKE